MKTKRKKYSNAHIYTPYIASLVFIFPRSIRLLQEQKTETSSALIKIEMNESMVESVILCCIHRFSCQCGQMNGSVAVSIMRKQASTTNKCPEVKNQTQITKVANSPFFFVAAAKNTIFDRIYRTHGHFSKKNKDSKGISGQFHHDVMKFVNCRFNFFSSFISSTNAGMKSNQIQSFVRNFKRSPLCGLVCFILRWHFFR